MLLIADQRRLQLESIVHHLPQGSCATIASAGVLAVDVVTAGDITGAVDGSAVHIGTRAGPVVFRC